MILLDEKTYLLYVKDKEIQSFFDAAAKSRDRIMDNHPILAFEQFVRSRSVFEYLQPIRSDNILDIGCGNGRDLLYLAGACDKIIAIDYSNEMVRQSRQKLEDNNISNVIVSYGNATALEFDDNSFDKILCSEVIEHIPEWNNAIREIARVLRPGGSLVLSTPNRHSFYGFERYFIHQGLLKKAWPHPCDEWKTFRELKESLLKNGLSLSKHKGACYIPGFLFTHKLSPFLGRLLVNIISAIEQPLSHLLPNLGYMIVIRAKKRQ
jgi:ubiquinone biosynthesis O-methyltransferase